MKQTFRKNIAENHEDTLILDKLTLGNILLVFSEEFQADLLFELFFYEPPCKWPMMISTLLILIVKVDQSPWTG